MPGRTVRIRATSASRARLLERYRAKRDFSRTPEPAGHRRVAAAVGARRRFYIQRHAARRLHYDLRLELDGVLRSWAVPKGPSLDPAARRLAVQVEDHPLDYGTFEGVIPEGEYGAGEVVLWDQGTWSTEEDDPAAALARGKLRFRLAGEKLDGGWSLVRTGKSGAAQRQWLLIKSRDHAARGDDRDDITVVAPHSVKRVRESAARTRRARTAPAPLPAFVTPQLATLASAPPEGPGWVYEMKHDGYRLLARIEGRHVRLFTRSGRDWTAKLPRVARAVAALGPRRAWLDGEIVVQRSDGLSSFQALQNAFERGSDEGIVYFVFDLPFADGRDLTALPLGERKAKLARALGGAEGIVRYSDHLAADADAALEAACRRGLEGLIAKRLDAAYVGGRTRSWLKLKCRPRQEFVVVGYTDPGGARRGFGALLLGVPDESGRLRYVGRVGTGFDEPTLAGLGRRLAAMRRPTPPFEPPPALPRGAHWVRPTLVAEVAFAGWTDERLLRQASFLGLREDKPAAAVREERPVAPTASRGRRAVAAPVRAAGVAITHPERVLWDDVQVTKGDLARYYEGVAEWVMPHLRCRPLSLLRCPDGSGAPCFFQRHMGTERPQGVELVRWERSSKGQSYLFVSTIEATVGVVQRGAIEFHTWGCTVPRLGAPDRLTIDLDPDPALSWTRVAEAAMLTRTLLEALGLVCFLKTTGGKGLHIVVPLERRNTWDEAKGFARAVAVHLARLHPDRFTASVSKNRRGGRIFIDYLRNGDTATAVAAYSARARPGAPVSTPIDWAELDTDVRGSHFNVKNVPARLARLGADPWREYARSARRLTLRMHRALDAAAPAGRRGA